MHLHKDHSFPEEQWFLAECGFSNKPFDPVQRPVPLHKPLQLAFPILEKRDENIFLIKIRSLFRHQSYAGVKCGFIYVHRLEGLLQREFSSPGDK